MVILNAVVSFLNGELGSALIYLAAVAAADVILGSIVGHFWGGGFSLRKFKDFVVTTVGWQHTLAFLGALLLMYVRRDPYTAAAVAGLAILYATATLPDLYDKLSTLFFGGRLPASQNLRAPTPAS